MGQTKSTLASLASKIGDNQKPLKEEFEDLHWTTIFTVPELEKLYGIFSSISSSIDDDGVIDVEEFQCALGIKNNMLAKRAFSSFDENGDKVITFREFVSALSVLCQKGATEEKLKLSFKIYDIDGDGYIDKEELYGVLKATLSETCVISLTEQQMRELVDQTFLEVDANSDGKISFEEFKEMVRRHPAVLNTITIDSSVLL